MLNGLHSILMDEKRKMMFLGRAKDAEEQAQQTKDPEARQQWLKIAETYRQLIKPAPQIKL